MAENADSQQYVEPNMRTKMATFLKVGRICSCDRFCPKGSSVSADFLQSQIFLQVNKFSLLAHGKILLAFLENSFFSSMFFTRNGDVIQSSTSLPILKPSKRSLKFLLSLFTKEIWLWDELESGGAPLMSPLKISRRNWAHLDDVHQKDYKLHF